MTPQELLAELEQRGVKLTVAGDKLRYDAPAGALTPELKEALRQHKAEIKGADAYDATPIVDSRNRSLFSRMQL